MEDGYLKDDSLSKDDNDFFESDEYDSDCSLGSMNSLYLHFKRKRSFQNSRGNEKQLQYGNTNFSKTDDIATNNTATRTHVLEVKQFNNNVKNPKLVENLSTVFFYGKQKSITQHIHTKLSYECQRKKVCVNSKTIKTSYTICKFKHKAHKLRISLKNRQHGKHSLVQKILDSKNIFQKKKNLLRYKLKEHIPLLKLKRKIKMHFSQESEKYSSTYKKFSEKKKDFITDCQIINNEDYSLEYRYIEDRISNLNSFLINDFMDSDDFGSTKVVEDIIKKLFDDDDSITDNSTIRQKNESEFIDFNHKNKYSFSLKMLNNLQLHD